MSKILQPPKLKPLLDKARELAPKYKPTRGFLGDTNSDRVCGLGLLMIADGRNPGAYTTNQACVLLGFTVTENGKGIDAAPYLRFDTMYDHIPGSDLFADWLDWMEQHYAERINSER